MASSWKHWGRKSSLPPSRAIRRMNRKTQGSNPGGGGCAWGIALDEAARIVMASEA